MSESEPIAAGVNKVPELAGGKLAGPPWPDAEKILDAILAAGAKGVVDVIDMIQEVDDGRDYKARYVLGALAVHACRRADQTQRVMLVDALASQLGGDRPKAVRGFLVRQLQAVGDKRSAPALAALLGDEELGADAVAALAAIGPDAAEHLRQALPQAGAPNRDTSLWGTPGPANRRAMLQALGVLQDAASAGALREAAADADRDTRIVALWALANIADAQAVDLAIRASAADGWEGIQACAACLLLAENLVAGNRKQDAARICEHLVKSRTGGHDAHVRDAAAALLRKTG